ncbi:hypothetical protein P885DRAFT_77579 [Corynascus similis CBS 632.67]
MAKTKQTAKKGTKSLITWTRFYLPQDQEWPVWEGGHADIYAGRLAEVEGSETVFLARMVDNPEQVAYIIGGFPPFANWPH